MSKKVEQTPLEDKAKQELKRAQEESAATIAEEPITRNTKASRQSVKPTFKVGGIALVICALILIASTVLATLFLSGGTYKKESTTFVEQIKGLATLATAEAHLKEVIQVEDNKLFGKNIPLNLPGTKREILLVVPATVIAGVDLENVASEDMKVDEDKKKLEIVLPRATLIQDPAIQMENVQTFSDEGLFRGEVEWDEGFDLAAEAQEKLKEQTIEIGLLETAEKNAEKVLKEFFNNLGYTVKITFN